MNDQSNKLQQYIIQRLKWKNTHFGSHVNCYWFKIVYEWRKNPEEEEDAQLITQWNGDKSDLNSFKLNVSKSNIHSKLFMLINRWTSQNKNRMSQLRPGISFDVSSIVEKNCISLLILHANFNLFFPLMEMIEVWFLFWR